MQAVEAVSLEANKSRRDTGNRANTVRISAARSPQSIMSPRLLHRMTYSRQIS